MIAFVSHMRGVKSRTVHTSVSCAGGALAVIAEARRQRTLEPGVYAVAERGGVTTVIVHPDDHTSIV
jgi:hypothetical protein